MQISTRSRRKRGRRPCFGRRNRTPKMTPRRSERRLARGQHLVLGPTLEVGRGEKVQSGVQGGQRAKRLAARWSVDGCRLPRVTSVKDALTGLSIGQEIGYVPHAINRQTRTGSRTCRTHALPWILAGRLQGGDANQRLQGSGVGRRPDFEELRLPRPHQGKLRHVVVRAFLRRLRQQDEDTGV